MKRTALLYPAALLSAALMASPAFAADDLCVTNLQTIKDTLTTKGTTLAESTKTEVMELQATAEKAHSAGDNKKCAEVSAQAVTKLQGPNTEGSGGGSTGGTGSGT
jgi:hypothetical protein